MELEFKLRSDILAEPHDTSRHDRYTEYLDRKGRTSLATYVRLFAKILSADAHTPEFCRLQSQRKEHLDFDPSCFQWDDYLSARHIRNYGPEIVRRSIAVGEAMGVRPSPADANLVEKLETLLEIELPTGYRAFLTQISNGSSFCTGVFTFDPLIYSVDQMIERLESSEKAIDRARSPSTYSWKLMMTKEDLEYDEANELVHPDDFGEPPPGFLEIGRGARAFYYLGLSR